MNKVRIGLLYSRVRAEEKMLIQAIKQHGAVTLELLCTNDLVLGFGDLPDVDVVLDREMSQSRALHVLNMLERSGVKAVNSYDTARIGGDKVLTSQQLAKAGVPTPRIKVAFSRKSALSAVEELGYPAILKPVDGSWGRLMAKIENRTAAEAILEHKSHLGSLYHGVFYLQEFIDKPDRDIRAFVIGGTTVAAVYRSADHWLTNAALGAKTVACPITPELDALCLKACLAVGGDAIAVDLMETSDGLTVHEVNCAMEFKASMTAIQASIPDLLIEHCVRVAQESQNGGIHER
jgi:[lysine-biosynthesis-protein LysW]---L-2-aminoadipate ligase